VSLPGLARAAAEILAFLDTKGRSACVIGGVAVSRWGEPRATQDVDITVLADFGDEPVLLAELLSRYPSRVPDPESFASANRVALLVLSGGVNADVTFAAFPFEREVIDRSTIWQLPDGPGIRTCSAEDLIIYKLVAGRPLDLHDIARIVQRQRNALDVGRVRYWGKQFAEIKDDPSLIQPFEEALTEAGLSD
jgi:hypothetical protein